MIELPVKKCIQLFSGEIDHFYATGVFNDDLECDENKTVIKDVKIVKDDFMSFVDNFHFKVMILAQRALENEKYLFYLYISIRAEIIL